MADLPEEIQGKLQSGYSLCHPEDDCAGQRAWMKAAGELETLRSGLREEIERLRGECEEAPALIAADRLQALLDSHPAGKESGDASN